MAINPDPYEKRTELRDPPLPAKRPSKAPWIALLGVFVLGLAVWMFSSGPSTDPTTTSSTTTEAPPSTISGSPDSQLQQAPDGVGEPTEGTGQVMPSPDSR